MEILLKHRELRLIDDEISKIYVMMLQIKRSYEDPKQAVASYEPPELAQYYAHYLDPKIYSNPNSKLSASSSKSIYSRNRSHSLASNHSSSSAQRQACVMRRSDGVTVKLVCPKCHRENFGSTQGFINHCRISHSLDFGSHDAAALACGVRILDSTEPNSTSTTSNNKFQKSVASSTTPESPHVITNTSNNITKITTTSTSTTNNNTNTTESTSNDPRHSSLTPPSPQLSNLYIHSDVIVSGPEPPTRTKNLSEYLRKRKHDIDMDLETVATESMKTIPKSHLLDDEEEEEEELPVLDEDATTFERALVEAKRLKLDIESIKRSSNAKEAFNNAFTGKARKRKAMLRGRRASSRVVGATAAAAQRAQVTAAMPSRIRSVSVESQDLSQTSDQTKTETPLGGKYRPGFAPLQQWNTSDNQKQEQKMGKSLPGRINSVTTANAAATTAIDLQSSDGEEDSNDYDNDDEDDPEDDDEESNNAVEVKGKSLPGARVESFKSSHTTNNNNNTNNKQKLSTTFTSRRNNDDDNIQKFIPFSRFL